MSILLKDFLVFLVILNRPNSNYCSKDLFLNLKDFKKAIGSGWSSIKGNKHVKKLREVMKWEIPNPKGGRKKTSK